MNERDRMIARVLAQALAAVLSDEEPQPAPPPDAGGLLDHCPHPEEHVRQAETFGNPNRVFCRLCGKYFNANEHVGKE